MDIKSFSQKVLTWIQGNWKVLLIFLVVALSYLSGCINAALLQSQECKSSGIIQDPIHFSRD
ncbi:hypothetical protein LEP1GSC185_3952 [Leptospira licerasiae serovar Varillal str. VAR 010]|nr:hypothetical protein LEP1GSC185_3952 [Leptospira licerasiae serovar Varillal str. VAR 010]